MGQGLWEWTDTSSPEDLSEPHRLIVFRRSGQNPELLGQSRLPRTRQTQAETQGRKKLSQEGSNERAQLSPNRERAEHLSKETEDPNTHQTRVLALKNTTTKINNSPDGLTGRMDKTEKTVNELDRVLPEITQPEQTGKEVGGGAGAEPRDPRNSNKSLRFTPSGSQKRG